MEKLRPGDPEQLGPYTMIARLGSGGMGVVFLGSKGSKRVAVKVVRSSFLDNPSLRTRFEREIETLKKLKSDHVAAYLDSDTEGELAWHAVEFINGPTLKERVEDEGPMSPDEWRAFYEHLRTALSDIHSFGVTHRDLKPSNIILSETGLKLIDFGIAHDSEATSITSIGMVSGSPAWLSPEQLDGSEVTSGSDLFSAGSILVFAAMGRSPWGDETTLTVPLTYQRIISRDLRIDGLSPGVRDAILPLMSESPGARYFPRGPSGPQPTASQGSVDQPVAKEPTQEKPESNVSRRADQSVARTTAKDAGERSKTVLSTRRKHGVLGALGKGRIWAIAIIIAAVVIGILGAQRSDPDRRLAESSDGSSLSNPEDNTSAYAAELTVAYDTFGGDMSTAFVVKATGSFAERLDYVMITQIDKPGAPANFPGSEGLDRCGPRFELVRQPTAIKDTKFFTRTCGGLAIESGTATIRYYYNDGSSFEETQSFIASGF